MTSRERVLRALRHQETDRPPVDFGGTVVTCLDTHAHRRLKARYGLPDGKDEIIDWTMGTVEPRQALQRRFGADCRRVGLNVTPPKVEGGLFTNGFGMVMKKADPHEYFDVVVHPLKDRELSDIADMLLPDAADPALYAGLAARARSLRENTDYSVIADFGVPGFFETTQKLRGYEQFACDLLLDPEGIAGLFDILLELQKKYFTNYMAQVGSYVDVVCYADDLGMQDRPQISPELYREVIKPYHKKIFTFIHGLTDAKLMLHSCGAVEPLIEDLIDAGVDILNPVQTRAAGMEPKLLKARYGGRLCFWGGIDEQVVLPHGTPQEVAQEVRRMWAELGGGGYVIGPGHNIQNDTPVENVEAMFDAVVPL